MRPIVLALVLCCGCGTYFTGLGHNVATGALDEVTGDAGTKRLTDLEKKVVTTARDEALGPTTDAELQKLITDTGITTRAQLNELIAGLITSALQEKLRETVRIAVNEALGSTTLKEVATFRETMVGMPLQKDLDDLIDSASPHLTRALSAAVHQAVQQAITVSIAPIKTDVDQEAAKWKPIAIGFAVGCGLLLIGLIFGGYVLWNHAKVIKRLTSGREQSVEP